jgi:hypothetical protein
MVIEHWLLADLQKDVTPMETGVQTIYGDSKRLDSGFRRNDGIFLTACCSLLTAYSLLHTCSVFRLPTISLSFWIPFSVQ